MAAIDFKTLTTEEVAGLNGKQKKAYEKWLANQNDVDPSNNNESDPLIEVESLVDGLNTTLYGNFKAGEKKQIGVRIAVQLEAQELVKCHPNEENKDAYESEKE